MAFNGNVAPTADERRLFLLSIDNGTHEVPAAWVAEDDALTEEQFDNHVPQAIKTFATERIRYLVGTQYIDVATEFFKGLALARRFNNPISLIRDMIISVYVAYTISRDWAASYANFGNDTIFAKFNIGGRQAANGAKDAWTNTSQMNATAMHLLGYLIVECAPVNSMLGELKNTKGTPFTPPAAQEGNEQNKLMRAAAGAITIADRNVLQNFRANADRAINVISRIFGAARVDINAAINAANAYAGTKI